MRNSSDLAESKAAEEVDLVNLDAVDLEAGALDVLVEPLLLEFVVGVAHRRNKVGDHGDEARGEARLGQQVHLDLLHDDELVVDRVKV